MSVMCQSNFSLRSATSAACGDLVVPRTRQPGILCGWSGRLEQSTAGHSFSTYIINVQKHVQDTIFSHVPTSLTNCFQSTSSEIVRHPCSDSIATLLRLINCRFIII